MIRALSMKTGRPALAVTVLVGLSLLLPRTATAAPVGAGLPPGAADSALALFDGGAVFPREFSIAWQRLSPPQRPAGTKDESRRAYLLRVVDRKLLSREVAKRPFTPTPAQQIELDRVRDRMIQNQLFERRVASLPRPTNEDLEIYSRRQRELALTRFITFTDADRAGVWRQRLATGTPMATLEAAVAREGATLASIDTFRLLAAEQIPDTLAVVIWGLRPGQVSSIHWFAGHPVLIHVKGFERRLDRLGGSEGSVLRLEYQRQQYDRVRERLRQDMVAQIGRTFDPDMMQFLLAAHLRVPPRRDVDSLSGVPTVRPNLPLPVFTAADTGKVIARTRDRRVTLLEYARFWEAVEPFARPEIRDMPALEAAVDRIVLDPEILKQGVREGLDQDPIVLETVAEVREGMLLDEFYATEIEGKVKMDAKGIQATWAKDPAHYYDRASIDSRILVVERRSLADSLLARLHGGASFDQLARDYSMDGQTAIQGGKTGAQYRGSQRNVGLEDAMFATEKGQVGGPEFTPEGWVLWRIEDKLPEVKRSFEEARPMVERDYRTIESERLLAARLAGMRKAAGVRTFPERIDVALSEGGVWPE